MSAPEPTPFAVYVGHTEDDGHKTLIGGVPIYFGMELSARRAVDTSNAAVQRERQAAAVKALWDAVDALDAVLGESAKFDPAANWLRGRAEAMQYIASRAERAEKETR